MSWLLKKFKKFNNSTMENEKSFDKLPIEIISHIFAFLELRDKKNASTVCWSWYEASIHPMFLKNEVIYLRDTNDGEIENQLKIYAKSLRPIFNLQIYGVGTTPDTDYDNDPEKILDENHWVNTIWPLVGPKVLSLEFVNTYKFIDGLIPAILNGTKELKILKIDRLYCTSQDMYKVKKLESLRELSLARFFTNHIDKNKLFGIIPKHLSKLSLKYFLGSDCIIQDIIKVLKYCALNLETLELIDVDVTPELMQEISKVNMKIKDFCLVLSNTDFLTHDPEILSPLFETQWPLIKLTLHADCVTNELEFMIVDTFKKLKYFSLTSNISLRRRRAYRRELLGE